MLHHIFLIMRNGHSSTILNIPLHTATHHQRIIEKPKHKIHILITQGLAIRLAAAAAAAAAVVVATFIVVTVITVIILYKKSLLHNQITF